MSSGLNTDVEHRGRVYHVQTENTIRSGPAVETLIFENGEILVRMTAPSQHDSDKRQALELQHWDLVRKIHNGMLDDKEAEAACGTNPAVQELLVELDQRLDEIFVARRAAPALPQATWWERRLGRVSVVVRW